MENVKIGILEPDNFSEAALMVMSQYGTVSKYNVAESLFDFIEDKNVLFIRLKHYISKEFLDKAENLWYVCTPTTGLNHLDMSALKLKGVDAISLKGEKEFLSTIRATPEHAFGLTLSLLRNYGQAFITDVSEWDRDRYRGEEVYGSKVGIIGYGRVGKIVAKYFRAFDSEVYVYDINRSAYDGMVRVSDSVKALIGDVDIVILTASYEGERNLINDSHLFLMKNKYFVNVARGELVDETALIRRIELGWFKGVAIDVIADEARDNNMKMLLNLTGKHNLIITPHIGGATYLSMHRTEEFIANKLVARLKHRV